MTRLPPPSHRIPFGALLCAALVLPALVQAAAADPSAVVPQSALQACAVIATDAERLACYDRLSGHSSHGAAAPAAAAPAASAASAAPVPTPPATASAPAATAATAGAAAATVVAATPAASAPAAASFGSYAVEHPAAPPKPTSLEARVVELGKSPAGHMTVSLEGGAVWELDTDDPVLVVGDIVNIHRAALGSFLMDTPSKRTHRVHRLH